LWGIREAGRPGVYERLKNEVFEGVEGDFFGFWGRGFLDFFTNPD
jgi:hypothetical protein